LDHLAGSLENNGAPSFAESVSFGNNVDNFGLKLLFSSLEGGPDVVAYGTFLEEGLESGFVVANAEDTVDIGDGATKKSSFKDGFGCWGTGLKESDVCVAFRMRGEPWFRAKSRCGSLAIYSAEGDESADVEDEVGDGDENRGHRGW